MKLTTEEEQILKLLLRKRIGADVLDDEVLELMMTAGVACYWSEATHGIMRNALYRVHKHLSPYSVT